MPAAPNQSNKPAVWAIATSVAIPVLFGVLSLITGNIRYFLFSLVPALMLASIWLTAMRASRKSSKNG